MTNPRIASRILEVLAAYERGEASAFLVAQSIELHEPAMEGVSQSARERLHRLSVQVIQEDASPLEQEQLGIPAGGQALRELKLLLQSLKQ
jgi:hypothetical protein